MHMYCAHQQWLLAPEIDYVLLGGEGDFLLVRAAIARDHSSAEVVENYSGPSNQQHALE